LCWKILISCSLQSAYVIGCDTVVAHADDVLHLTVAISKRTHLAKVPDVHPMVSHPDQIVDGGTFVALCFQFIHKRETYIRKSHPEQLIIGRGFISAGSKRIRKAL